MSQPPAYTPATDFSADETNKIPGRSTLRTTNLDTEFVNIKAFIDAMRTNIALAQADDGTPRDDWVDVSALDASVRTLMAAEWTPRGAWLTATAYVVKDVVVEAGISYMCAIAHTSGVFATDLAAIKWISLAIAYNPVDSTSTDTTRNKLVSNNDAKGWTNLLKKNLILNGSFNHWQRGTSFVSGNPAVDVADMFQFWRGAFVTGGTFTQQPASAGVKGKWVGRMQRDNANTSLFKLNITHAFESVNSIPLAGKEVTLSIKLRKGANYSGGDVSFIILSGIGTDQPQRGGNFTGEVNVAIGSATLSTAFQTFTVTGTMPTNSTQLGLRIYYVPTGTAGANDWVEIGEVKLEEGPVATEFVYPDFLEELAKVRNHYRTISRGVEGSWNFTTSASFGLSFIPPMRAMPVLTLLDTAMVIIVQASAVLTASSGTMNFSTGPTKHGANINLFGFTGATTDAGAAIASDDVIGVDAAI